jgi:TonB-linked SusC/RagA family outer membrane protein
MTAGAVKADATSSATSWALVSYFSRVNYNYQGKYFLDLSARIDGSSRFGPNNRYGFFPAASAAWRISEEDFMSNVSFLSDLKLRAGVGVTGNQEIGNFGYLALFGAGADYLQQGGLAPAQLANPDLKWETTTQYNAGLDIGLFNRVNLSVDYFVKQTQDLLLSTPIPATSGFTSILRNVGGVESTGWEFTLSATPLGRDKAFQWTSDFNISFIKNKVTNLPDDVPPFATGFANWVEEGQPIGSFRGYVVEGLFQTQDEINALNANSPTGVYQSTRTSPGDIKFKDLNGDGVITSDDQTIIGSALPDFFGGWTNTFKYKNLDLMVFLQYSYGNEIYNNTRAFFAGMNGIFGQGEEVLKRWTPENPNTDVPRAVYGDPNNNRRTSTRWIEDGSYLRVKNVALGYTLSPEVLRKLNLSNLRIYIAAQNLFTFTNYSGLDPEVNTFGYSNTSLGTDFLTYPNARTYMIGVNLGL